MLEAWKVNVVTDAAAAKFAADGCLCQKFVFFWPRES